MKRKTDAEIEEAKILVKELFTKFSRVSKETQTEIIEKLSNFIDDEDHRKTKDFFRKLKMIFEASMEANSNEK